MEGRNRKEDGVNSIRDVYWQDGDFRLGHIEIKNLRKQ